MDNNASVLPPTSITEVEQLVKRLYSGANPQTIAQIDDQLRQLQHSHEGWRLADELLSSQDKDARFFAALTFQIKLNNDGTKLDASTAQSVLMRLLYWTTQLVRSGESNLVLRKLCGSLSTYFIRSRSPWKRPLLHLAACFRQTDAVTEDQLPESHDALSQLLPGLNGDQLTTLLWLCSTLAVDSAKLDSTTPESAQVHQRMEALANDASKVISYALRQSSDAQPMKLKGECLSCFLNWVNYAQSLWTTAQGALSYLQSLVVELAPLLTESDLQNEAMDVFRDILESYTTFFKPSHMELLAAVINQYARPRLLQGLQHSEPEVIPVAQLVIAYGIANIQQIVEAPTNEDGSKVIVQLLLAILEAPGYPGDDDEVSIHSIEFWNTYIEYVNEAMYSRTTDEPTPPWLEHDRQVCMRLSTLLWSKMRTPPPELAEEWSSDESEGFKEFRMDASDLMLSIFVRLGNDMLQQFITLALDSLAMSKWQDLEAALFAINTLADNVLEDPRAERLLIQVFSSSLFRDIADFSQPIPAHVRRTAIDTIGTYGQYIERHAEFLPDSLRFLFSALDTVGLSISAAKSIESLCSTCRNSLTGELDGFLAQYNSFAQSENSEPYTIEKVIGAIAAIVQAIKPESAKAEPLSALLDIVDRMVTHTERLLQISDMEAALVQGVSAIECLHRIGKGLQVPEDVPISLYDDDESKPKDEENFWHTAPGQAIQKRIYYTCLSLVRLLPSSGEVIDQVCSVLKAGFAETEPGPFVFAPNISISFLMQCSLTTPHLESVLSMIATLVGHSSRSDRPKPIDNDVARIHLKAWQFIQELKEPSEDPGIAQCCIDVCNNMFGRYTSVVLDVAGSGAMLHPVLHFALKAVDGADLMPKRAAADFWRRLVQLGEMEDNTVRAWKQQVVVGFGPLLVQTLMNQITGRGQRSELDQLCEPLKALVMNYPQSKTWMESALLGDSLPPLSNPGIGEVEKRRFVQQVVALRGDSRRTRDVVRNFYAACRGTVTTYG